MSETSRRKFLATTGAGAVAGTVAATGTAQAAAVRRDGRSAQETVVAFVADHRRSELRLLVGEREVIVQDHDLVTRILNAAGGE